MEKHVKSCFTSLSIKKMQIKISVRYHYTLARMWKIKTVTTPNAGEDAEKLDPSHCWWESEVVESLAVSCKK
jgi:hypothetical protein